MAGTVIGEGLTIEGDISGDEEIVIHGNLRGRLTTTDAVTVGGTAVVGADITGASLSVAGQVTGDVTASERVDIQAGGKLVGDIKAARFTIADGASFKGNVDMDV
jgi:cytoskeletal protein CcmA (bactofilin family)